MFNLLLLLFYCNFIFTCAMVTNFDPCRVASSSSRLRILIASSTAGVFSLHARGPAFKHYAALFQDECNKGSFVSDFLIPVMNR